MIEFFRHIGALLEVLAEAEREPECQVGKRRRVGYRGRRAVWEIVSETLENSGWRSRRSLVIMRVARDSRL